MTLLCDKLKQWQIEYNSIEDDRVKWELLKYEIRKFSMSYCSQKKLDRQKEECTKKKELEQIEIELAAKPSIESMLKFERLKSDILDIETERINGAIIRSKVRWVEEGEKSTIFFFDLEKNITLKNAYTN